MRRARLVFTVVGLAIAAVLVTTALALRPSSTSVSPSGPFETPVSSGTSIPPADGDVSTTEGPPPSGPDDECRVLTEIDDQGNTSITVMTCSDAEELPTVTVPADETGPTDETGSLPPPPPGEGSVPECHGATTVPGGTLPTPQCDDE